MGITIHYSGQARDQNSLTRLIAAAAAFATARNWPHTLIDDPAGTTERFDPATTTFIDLPGPVRGIILNPHPQCEPVTLLFAGDLTFESFTKTQFASFDIHAAVIDLLRSLGPHLRSLEVIDEAGLWDTGDPAAAQNTFNHNRRIIDTLAQHLRAEGHQVEAPDDEPPTP